MYGGCLLCPLYPLLLVLIPFWGVVGGRRLFKFEWEWEGGGWGGVGAYSRLGASSRWALIQGWALIRINTVNVRTSGNALVSG